MSGATREPSSSSETHEFNSDDEDHGGVCYLFQIKYLIHFLTVAGYYRGNSRRLLQV